MREGEGDHEEGPAGPVKQAFESYGPVGREVKSGASKRYKNPAGLARIGRGIVS
jgi:hypothetical protein